MILDLPYYDDAFSAIVAAINVEQDEEFPNKKAPYLTDDHKCVDFIASSGLGADPNKTSLIDHFGIRMDNLQTLHVLFQ